MSQWCHHPVQLSSINICAISQASPTKKAKGDSGKEPKLHRWQKWRKNLGKNQAQLGQSSSGQRTSMAWFNSRLQHRSDCAEVLSGSYVLVLMVVEVTRSSQSICISLTWSPLTFRAVEIVSQCWSTIWSGYGLDVDATGTSELKWRLILA